MGRRHRDLHRQRVHGEDRGGGRDRARVGRAGGDGDRHARPRRGPDPHEPVVPAQHAGQADGGHDWSTWRVLWQRLLRSPPWDPSAEPPSLEVPDGRGGWTTARDNLGFPSGKEKTILLDLTDVFLPGTERRVRLRTNLEVYWDALAWAVPQPGADVRTTRLPAASADLRYRGFSAVTEADRTSPEIPHYDDLRGTHPYWRDLVGYHTRFGDVRELIEKVEDRYVIMNAGDELALLPPLAGG